MRVSGWIVLMLGCAVGAQTPPVGPPAPANKPVALEALKLPSGSIVVVTDGKATLDRVDAVVLTPEQFRELRETIEQLRKQAQPALLIPPSEIRLSGKLEPRAGHESMRFKAIYEFKTRTPNELVPLGCKKARPLAATLNDGHRATLLAGDDGLSALVETAGAHALTLEVEVPLSVRGSGSERGVELDLPGAPITRLTFEPPAGVGKVRLTGQPSGVDASSLAPTGAGRALPAGAKALELFWDGPTAVVEPLLAAEGDLRVIVDEDAVTVDALLTLRVLRGATTTWSVQAPPAAELTVRGVGPTPSKPGVRPVDPPLAQPPDLVPPSDTSKPWLLRWSEPRAEPIRVQVQYRLPRPRDGKPLALALVAGLGATQQGTLSLSAPPHLRLRTVSKGDLRPRDTDGDDNGPRVAFTYALPIGRPTQLLTPVLDVWAEPLAGVVQTQATHTLTLTETGWRLSVRLEVVPNRTEVERLEVDMPPELQDIQAGPADVVESIVPGTGPKRTVQIRLARPRRTRFQVTLEGLYPQPPTTRSATLLLPRVRQALERDARVIVQTPAGLAVRAQVQEWDRESISTWERPLEPTTGTASTTLTATLARAAARVELHWPPQRPLANGSASVDVTLMERQAHVRQQFRLTERSTNVLFRGPTQVTDVRAEVGTIASRGPGEWLATPSNGVLTLVLAVPLAGGPFTVPLLVPDGAVQWTTQVRVWPARSGQVTWTGGAWEEQAPEASADRQRLPALVLSGPAMPLVLTWRPNELPDGRVLIERALVQAVPVESGGHWLRARFRVRVLADEPIEIDLPAGAEHPEVFSAGRPLVAWQRHTDARGRDVLRLDAGTVPSTALLEVRCTVASERTGLSTVTLNPPSVRGVVLPGALRWQITWPAPLLPMVVTGDVVWEQRWTWARGLWTPTPAVTTADLERWLNESPGDEPTTAEPLLVGRAATWTSVRIQSVSRWGALWTGTLLVLGVGMGLAQLARWRIGAAASVASVLGVAGLVLAFGWPQIAVQVIWAGQLGVLALLIGGTLHLSWRYWLRWRAQRMRGFSRALPGSGIMARPGSSRLQLRPSTEVTASE